MRIGYDPRARYRLAAALTASVIVHAWFVHGYGERERSRPAAAGSPIHATLVNTDIAVSENAPRRSETAEIQAEKTATDVVRIVPAPGREPMQQRRGVEVARAVSAEAQLSALPTPQDPTYYSARSLDVFPARLTAWDTSAIRAAAQGAGGSVRVMLLIDEVGAVNEVESVQGAALGSIDIAIRDLFLTARFSPARKDGRVVKARVLVNLDF